MGSASFLAAGFLAFNAVAQNAEPEYICDHNEKPAIAGKADPVAHDPKQINPIPGNPKLRPGKEGLPAKLAGGNGDEAAQCATPATGNGQAQGKETGPGERTLSAMEINSESASIVANASEAIANSINALLWIIGIASVVILGFGAFGFPRIVRKEVEKIESEIQRNVEQKISQATSDVITAVSIKAGEEYAAIHATFSSIASELDKEAMGALGNAVINTQAALKEFVKEARFEKKSKGKKKRDTQKIKEQKKAQQRHEKQEKVLAQIGNFDFSVIRESEGMASHLLGIISPKKEEYRAAMKYIFENLDTVPESIQIDIVKLLKQVERAENFGPSDMKSRSELKVFVSGFEDCLPLSE